jgi:anti-anti-sigma regulatory factor
MLKIEKEWDGSSTVIRLIGRVQCVDVDELRTQMEDGGPRFVLDLDQVNLVDVDVVKFLCSCKERGVELVHCSPYIREWIVREQGNEAGGGINGG